MPTALRSIVARFFADYTKALTECVGRYDERMCVLIDYGYIKRLYSFVRPVHVNEVTFVHGTFKIFLDQLTLDRMKGMLRR